MKRYNIFRSTILLTFFTACWLLVSPVSAASIIVVNTTDDIVADDALCSLREAIIAANSGASFNNCTVGSAPYTIDFASGLPTPATFTLTRTGAGEDAGDTGDLDLTGAFTISGAGAANTIIDGNATDRVLHIHPAADVSISGVTIQNGFPGSLAYGGGINVELTGRLALDDSTLTNNSAAFGGGAYNLGSLTLNNSTVSTNKASGLRNNGGRLVLNGVQTNNNEQGFGIINEQSGILEVTGGEVRDNKAGGVQNNKSTATLTNLSITGNSGGSGVHNLGTNTATLTIKNSVIDNNSASSGAGLANASPSAKATVENTRISFNIASVNGGGISNSGILTLNNSAIDNNQARSGGGINHQGLSFKAQNVTISGNTASDNGGGIVNQMSATLTNVTLTGNSASGPETGGNIFNDGDSPHVIFANTIVANPGPGGNCDTTVGAMSSLGHNLESTNTCNFSATGDQVNTDPLLGPLQDNGGPTPTHALLSGSPAIDHGDDAKCPAIDQRGASRPVGASCDIGAVEANGAAPIYAVDLSPDAAKSGAPGQAVAYTLHVTNNGNVTDTFDLSVSSNNWMTDLSGTSVTLPAGQTTDITASVTIPAGAPGNATDMASVSARSQGAPSINTGANLTTTATTVYGVSLSPNQAKQAQPGQSATYSVTVTNTGNMTDTFNLTVSGNNWPSDLSSTSVTLEPGLSTPVKVIVNIPSDTAIKATDVATISANSQTDAGINATTRLTTTSVKLLHLYCPIALALAGE